MSTIPEPQDDDISLKIPQNKQTLFIGLLLCCVLLGGIGGYILEKVIITKTYQCFPNFKIEEMCDECISRYQEQNIPTIPTIPMIGINITTNLTE